MEIGLYEDWMKPQVARLFHLQYGIKEEDFAGLIDAFYGLSFQKNKCIRVIAKEGDVIIGFQSFFCWPYTRNGHTYNSYQSGNSLVHPDHRGKGIFQKLLNYLDEHPEKFSIDFLTGFPVEQSKNSFIRNQWNNILDLQWHLKLLNPVAFAFDPKRMPEYFEPAAIPIKENIRDQFRLTRDNDFLNWRESYSSANSYLYHSYTEGSASVSFQLKLNQRNRWFRELIIGDILASERDQVLIKKAISSLIRKARKRLSITALTIALNEHADTEVLAVIRKLGFMRTNKKIYFIVKPFRETEDLLDKRKWLLYRSDIDTW